MADSMCSADPSSVPSKPSALEIRIGNILRDHGKQLQELQRKQTETERKLAATELENINLQRRLTAAEGKLINLESKLKGVSTILGLLDFLGKGII